ncbi:MAG: PadR family transcriptional regulator [Acidimicrobiales bacterium]
MLELAILGLLKEQDLHGYELKKRLSDTLGLASGVSFGSLYPALGRLENAGAVEAVLVAGGTGAAAAPLTGSISGELAALRSGARRGRKTGRSKKVYAITRRGEELFEELLTAQGRPGDDDRTFNLRLAFARYLSPDARMGMLEWRRAHIVERLVRLRARVKAACDPDGYAHSLMEHDREAAEHDLSWIDRLIESERAGGPRAETLPAPRSRLRAGRAPRRTRSTTTNAGTAVPSISGLRPTPTQEDITL